MPNRRLSRWGSSRCAASRRAWRASSPQRASTSRTSSSTAGSRGPRAIRERASAARKGCSSPTRSRRTTCMYTDSTAAPGPGKSSCGPGSRGSDARHPRARLASAASAAARPAHLRAVKGSRRKKNPRSAVTTNPICATGTRLEAPGEVVVADDDQHASRRAPECPGVERERAGDESVEERERAEEPCLHHEKLVRRRARGGAALVYEIRHPVEQHRAERVSDPFAHDLLGSSASIRW